MLCLKLNAQGTLTLSVNNESVHLDAEELDQQIAHLSSLRAQMQQGVPEQPPPVQEVVINPRYMIRIDKHTKACLLRIRHAGLGWLNFEIPPQEVPHMKDVWNEIAEKLDLEPHSVAQRMPESPTNLH